MLNQTNNPDFPIINMNRNIMHDSVFTKSTKQMIAAYNVVKEHGNRINITNKNDAYQSELFVMRNLKHVYKENFEDIAIYHITHLNQSKLWNQQLLN
ncbi:MAG: hypothetical protein WC707_06885 [Candidatus Babeliaceae bacterium]